MSIRVMTIFGTRPEAIKMAPLVQELSRRKGLESLCCVTAQHREMLDSVLSIFRLTPDYDLNIMEPRQTLSTITSKCLLGVERVLTETKPDLVLVHGDTSTTFSAAFSSFFFVSSSFFRITSLSSTTMSCSPSASSSSHVRS